VKAKATMKNALDKAPHIPTTSVSSSVGHI
jgi:hypothetical protein